MILKKIFPDELSLLFSILYGRVLFKEEGFYERLGGGLLILAGIALIGVL